MGNGKKKTKNETGRKREFLQRTCPGTGKSPIGIVLQALVAGSTGFLLLLFPFHRFVKYNSCQPRLFILVVYVAAGLFSLQFDGLVGFKCLCVVVAVLYPEHKVVVDFLVVFGGKMKDPRANVLYGVIFIIELKLRTI